MGDWIKFEKDICLAKNFFRNEGEAMKGVAQELMMLMQTTTDRRIEILNGNDPIAFDLDNGLPSYSFKIRLNKHPLYHIEIIPATDNDREYLIEATK